MQWPKWERERPEGELDGLRYDYEVGRSYKVLADSKGFGHYLTEMERIEKSMLESLVNDRERADMLRGAIWALRLAREIPNKMVELGADAERVMRQEGFKDE